MVVFDCSWIPAECHRNSITKDEELSAPVERKRTASNYCHGTAVSKYPFSRIQTFCWGEKSANSVVEAERLCRIFSELAGLLQDIDAGQVKTKECESCILKAGRQYLYEVCKHVFCKLWYFLLSFYNITH